MYPEITTSLHGETWAICRAWLDAAVGMLEDGVEVSARRKVPTVKGNVAVIPIHGMITQRGSIWDSLFGGTSTMAFEAAFQRAINSDRIGAVVLDVNSPGGTTFGVQAAADRVFAARGTKPIYAVSNSLNASAAYWISSQADMAIAAPGSETGSIGAFRMHEDVSAAMEQRGVKMTFFASPPGKVAGNPFEPASKAFADKQMAHVNETYGEFVAAVTRSRGLTRRDIDHLDGDVLKAKSAMESRLVDRVATLPVLLAEMGVGKTASMDSAGLVDAWESGDVERPRLRYKAVERRRLKLDK